MHQFVPAVRGLFPEPPPDDVVEAATAYLYRSLAGEVFGARFARRLRQAAANRYKFADARTIDRRVERIATQREAFLDAAEDDASDHDAGFASSVRSAIRSILAEGDAAFEDQDLVKGLFPRFEDIARRIKTHLEGIRQQSRWVMRNS